MKSRNITYIFYLAAVVGMLFTLVTTSAVAGRISDSKYNFSLYDETNKEICVVCHTFHGANIGVLEAPLWSRDLSQMIYQSV